MADGHSAQYISWDYGTDPLTENDYNAIAASINTSDIDVRHDLTIERIKWSFKARHFIYYKGSGYPSFHNGQVTSWGDCGTGGVNLGGTGTALQALGDIQKGSSYAGLAVGTAASLSHAGVGAVAGLAHLAPILGPIGIGIALVIAPLAFVFAHHAKAVALEQNDLCGAFRKVNPLLDDIDANFYAGNITADQAAQGLDYLRQDITHLLQDIRKSCNAACVMLHELDGQIVMRTKYLYPKWLLAHPLNAISSVSNAVSAVTKGQGMSLFIEAINAPFNFLAILLSYLNPTRGKYPDGTLIKASGPAVYVIRNGIAQWVKDGDTLNAYFSSHGLGWGNVVNISDSELSNLPRGTYV